MSFCCNGKVAPSGMKCNQGLYKCEKCGFVGCTNRKCSNYAGSSSHSSTSCGKCGGQLKRMK